MTGAQQQLLGGNWREIVGDGLASKDKTVAAAFDYYNKRDARYADLVRSEHAMANRGQTMGFVGNLLGAAAMLAG